MKKMYIKKMVSGLLTISMIMTVLPMQTVLSAESIPNDEQSVFMNEHEARIQEEAVQVESHQKVNAVENKEDKRSPKLQVMNGQQEEQNGFFDLEKPESDIPVSATGSTSVKAMSFAKAEMDYKLGTEAAITDKGISEKKGDSNFTYAILEDGTAEITGYVGEMNGDLIIPDSVDGYSVASIGGHAFNQRNFTGDLIIPESIKSIGERAFSGCGFTGELKLPESLTSIGEYAFNGCRFMGVLILPASVEYIGKGAFVGSCKYIVVQEIKEGFDKNAFCDSIYIDGKPSMRVDETYRFYITNNTSQILSLAETSWVSSDPNIATVNSDGRVTGVSPGKADITIQLYNGMTTKLSIIVEKKAKEYRRGDITWYIPDKIKLGYRFRDEDNRWIDDGLSIAKVENIPEEKRTGDYYCICKGLIDTAWGLFSTLPLSAMDLTYPVTEHKANPTYNGFYAVRPGKISFQIKMWNKVLNTFEIWGEPYVVTVEEPVITTNVPQISYVGDTLTLRSELQNTELENESVNYYKEKVAEAKLNGSSIYGVGENLVYEPQFIIESGAELVETSDGDFSQTLTASEKLRFKGSGTVKLRVKYKHLKLMDEEGCTNGYYDFYSPEKTITIQVKDKPQENVSVTSVTLNKKSLDLKKGKNFKLGISIIIKGRTKGRSDKKASFFICLLIWRAFGFAELNKVASGIWGFNFPDPLKIIMTFTSASLYSGAFRL